LKLRAFFDDEPKKSPDAHGIGASPVILTLINMKIYRRRRTMMLVSVKQPASSAKEDGSGTVDV
jgi:hypothetical protein